MDTKNTVYFENAEDNVNTNEEGNDTSNLNECEHELKDNNCEIALTSDDGVILPSPLKPKVSDTSPGNLNDKRDHAEVLEFHHKQNLSEGSSNVSEIIKIPNDDKINFRDEVLSSPKPGCSNDSTSIKGNDTPLNSRLKNNIAPSNDNLNLTDKNNSISEFKMGIICSSTPLHGPPSKKRKTKCDNLSAIEEIEEATDSESTILNSVLDCHDKVVKQTPFEEKTLQKCRGEATVVEDSSDNKTILKKDKLSLIIDMPDCKISDLSNCNDTKNNDDSNLTVKVNDNELVVYKNVKDKTIDEVYIGAIDKFELDYEPDREEILQKANNLKEFISKDEQENNDNNDPEWELLKKLETDDERYKAVRKLWMNLTIPDPKDNLTTFNWRNKNSLEPPKNIEFPTTSDVIDTSDAKYDCTEFFDRAIAHLHSYYLARRRGVDIDNNYEYEMLSGLKKNPMNRNGPLVDLHQLHAGYQERLHRNSTAKQEILAVHKFYNGLKNREENCSNLMTLNNSEFQEILDIDNMITSYSTWYKS